MIRLVDIDPGNGMGLYYDLLSFIAFFEGIGYTEYKSDKERGA